MSRATLILRLIGITAMVFLPFSNRVVAQTRQSGEIRGTVSDQSGAVIPDVEVTITNVLTGVSLRVTTNASGVYEAPYVSTGDYTITFVKSGFRKLVRSGITLPLETITVDATLQVGSTSSTIEVKAEAPLIQSENAEQTTSLPGQDVTEIPDVGRRYYDMLALMPGVNGGNGASSTNGESIGVNGYAQCQYNWQIDGSVAMLAENQNPDIMRPPLDSIAEITYTTSNFGAEYGNGLAVFGVTTKGGTNQYHGSLYEFNQNNDLDARNFFETGAVPPLVWNQFGGTLGGPIKRDKLFFFFSYQKETNVESQTFYTPGPLAYVATVPTPAMRAGDFSNPVFNTIYDPSSLTMVNGVPTRTPLPGNSIPQSNFDPIAAKIQSYFPLPNLPGEVNNYYYAVHNSVPLQFYNGRVDYNLRNNNRLTASFMRINSPSLYGAVFSSIDAVGYDTHEYQGQLTDIWTIRPNLLAQFRAGFSYENLDVKSVSDGVGYPQKLGFTSLPANLFPAITIEGSVAPPQIGEVNPPAMDHESIYTPSATITWIKSKHIVKFGGEFDRWIVNGCWPCADAGGFDFDGIFTGNPASSNRGGEGYADFLFGLPDTWRQSAPADTGGRMWNEQEFVQDEYKILPHLTLTYGLRYVRQAGWSEAKNRVSTLDFNIVNSATGLPPALWYGGQDGRRALENTKNFYAPRLGIAWSPARNWSVRAAYGIYNLLWGSYAYGSGMGVGWGSQGFLTSTDQITPIFTLVQGPPPAINSSNATRTPELLNGQSVSYYPPNEPVAYSEQYRFDVQYQLGSGLLFDVAYVGNRALKLPFSRDTNQVPEDLLGPGNAQLRRPYPEYAQIFGATKADFSNYNALQTRIEKRFSHGLTMQANYTYSMAMDTMTVSGFSGAPAVWQNAYDIRADYGPAAIDMTHTFTGYVIYQLPVGKGRQFLNRGGGLNAILGGWQLSSLLQLHSGIPFTPLMLTNLSGALSGSWRPNRIASGRVSNPTTAEWFNPTAFAEPAPYTFGDSGRDFLYGPGYKDVDLCLAKSFVIPHLGEKTKLQFRADAFDFLNLSNWGQPNANIGSAAASTITSSSTSRRLQLGLRLTF